MIGMGEGLLFFKKSQGSFNSKCLFPPFAPKMTRRSQSPAQTSSSIIIRNLFSEWGGVGDKDRGQAILPELKVETIYPIFSYQKPPSNLPQQSSGPH